ncbi:hypothetical protein [Allostreptomyces psammosilenae]|uniref:Uncharacterized protein n=1 Tax=Allostreptomyces psammosilenae TaxID=1892865 RepID=A0A852ZVH6_9ACTN|nr:hypothetical protein [Allostreptomyces psammosilenae]NYI05250.1 hypothetical protein [Allostreptomyces psammosilenae]
MLIRHLPEDSMVVRTERGEAADWGLAEHLLAAVVDHLAAANWMFSVVHRDEHAEMPDRPEPVSRPGDRADGVGAASHRGANTPDAGDLAPASATPEEIARFFR